MKINRQSYLAELAKLLGFMSSWDRQAALDKYNALFDEAGDEASLIKMLGSPTHLAISLANSYVPTPAPAAPAAEEKPESPFAEFEEPEEQKAAEPSEPGALPAVEEIVPEPEVPAAPKRRVRAFGLIVSILFSLVIGLPIAIALICVGIPFLGLGVGIVAADVAAVLELFGALTMVSDILMVVGVGLVIAAIGLFVAWFGLWLSLALGQLWIGGVILRACRAMTYKKEVPAE